MDEANEYSWVVPVESGPVVYGRTPVIDQVIEAFMQSIDASETTRTTYRKAITIFMDWIGESGRSLNTMTPPDIIAYKDSLLDQSKSAMTVNLYLSVVRRFYKWTKFSNLYPNIADGIASVRTNRKTFRKMHLEDEEGALLLEHEAQVKPVSGSLGILSDRLKESEKVIARRNFAMVNLMLRTGLRTIEVSRADVGDIVKKKGKRLLKVWGKGHAEKDDFVVLTDEAYNPI